MLTDQYRYLVGSGSQSHDHDPHHKFVSPVCGQGGYLVIAQGMCLLIVDRASTWLWLKECLMIIIMNWCHLCVDRASTNLAQGTCLMAIIMNLFHLCVDRATTLFTMWGESDGQHYELVSPVLTGQVPSLL